MARIYYAQLARAGKTKRQTPVVPKTSEKKQTNKKTRLRKKFNTEVKSRCNGDISAVDMSEINVGGLTHNDIDRQMFSREKDLTGEERFRSWQGHSPTRDTNTKKPHKKDRQPVDEFYFQQMFGDL